MDGSNGREEQCGGQTCTSQPLGLSSKDTGCYQDIVSCSRIGFVSGAGTAGLSRCGAAKMPIRKRSHALGSATSWQGARAANTQRKCYSQDTGPRSILTRDGPRTHHLKGSFRAIAVTGYDRRSEGGDVRRLL